MLKGITFTTTSITDMDKIALMVAKAIQSNEIRPYIINVFGAPNSGKSTLANQVARNLAQTGHFAQSEHFDSQYGRAWRAWKSVSPNRIIRRMDMNASRVERLQNPPIPSLGKYDIDIWENSSCPSDIQIDIKNLKEGKKIITVKAADENFIAILKSEFEVFKKNSGLTRPVP